MANIAEGDKSDETRTLLFFTNSIRRFIINETEKWQIVVIVTLNVLRKPVVQSSSLIKSHFTELHTLNGE